MLLEESAVQFDGRIREVLAQCGVDEPRAYELLFALQAPMRLLGLITSRQLQDIKLSMPRLILLTWLYFGEQLGNEQGVSPSRLSEFQFVSRNTISALLRSLENEGLIERTVCQEDRRRFNIRLSPAGHDLICTLIPEQGMLLTELFSDLSENEQTTLIALLTKLRQSLHERVAQQ
ncbi:MAG: MarR family transcriptional regulator [Chloroflexi bacterium]|nr:MarR family transcriptional regulator [Chloroflexota bacterium]MBU1748233.1 MarR family transcriptional regulator [Chloroflexota bacterium]MBU1877345.1 MarR family transcriptional regulator [Chloroflexota bacterium]